jgi:uncharacterized HAD superfamily protein
MTVGLDIDGVVADFITPFLKLLETRSGSGCIDPASITDPNFMQHPFLTKELIAECMETASYDPQFWRAMTPLLTADQWQTLERMSREHEVVFVTHRWVRDTYDIHTITCDWLRSRGLTRPVVHFTQENKSALIRSLKVKLFVDDRHENCADVADETNALVFMPNRPYNQAFTHPKVQRIHALDELWPYLK